jgi:hypothetical protein
MVDWSSYNESLVKCGEILLDFDVIDDRNNELEKMNKGREIRKFVYSDSFSKLFSYRRAYSHLPYGQTEGVVRSQVTNNTSNNNNKFHSIPSYSNISR